MGRDSPISRDRGKLAIAIASVGGIGFCPVAPGTAGSAAGAALFLATHGLGLLVHIALGLAVTALGIWASGASEVAFGRSDDGRIVIDEVAGQWIALTPLFALSRSGTPFLLAVVTAFVAFRVFDIWKPGPVRWAERRFSAGVGVMADDCIAGVLAALVVGIALMVGVWLGVEGIA